MHVTEKSLKNNPNMVEKQLKNTYVIHMFLRHILNDLNFISKLEANEKPSWVYSGSGSQPFHRQQYSVQASNSTVCPQKRYLQLCQLQGLNPSTKNRSNCWTLVQLNSIEDVARHIAVSARSELGSRTRVMRVLS